MSRLALLLTAITALPAHPAIIRGTVVEKLTGYSLSSATVTLQPVPAAGQAARATRTSDAGQFAFDNLPSGAYLVKATRLGFMPAEYGQKRWNSAGTVILLGNGDTASLRLPLSRYGSITGTVRDLNEVGIPDQNVAAYTSTQPPRYVTRARSDDRGVFRISGLEPGAYLVRTTGDSDNDRSYIPTFSRQTLRVEEARVIVVYPDEDSTDGDLRPIPGKLFDLTGSLALPYSQPGFTVALTLASDMGRTVVTNQSFHFNALAPVRYEIYAEARENPPGSRVLGGYMELQMERDLTGFVLPMNPARESTLVLEGAAASVEATAFVRRKDLAGTGPPRSLNLSRIGRVPLFPGRWEVLVAPPEGYYVERFSPVPRDTTALPQGWNDVLVGAFNFGRFVATLSNATGAIHGIVKASNAPAAGAPVFLETWDPINRRRLLDLRETRADLQGNYRFTSLPPGDYRILATYEYNAPDQAAMDAALAQPIRIESSANPQTDLELYGIP